MNGCGLPFRARRRKICGRDASRTIAFVVPQRSVINGCSIAGFWRATEMQERGAVPRCWDVRTALKGTSARCAVAKERS
jgi:hypothetical protein